jgi:hypothetical protein
MFLDELLGADVGRMVDSELADHVLALCAVADQVTAVLMGALAEADSRQVGAVDGAPNTPSWLSAYGRVGRGAAAGLVRDARRLRDMPATAQALAEGLIGPAKVRLLAGAINERTAEAFAADEAVLVEEAAKLTVDKTAKLVRYWQRVVDADGPDRSNDRQINRLHLSTVLGGRWRGDTDLDTESGAILDNALINVGEELRLAAAAAGEPVLSGPQLRAEALVELARRATAAGGRPAARPLVWVITSLAELLDHFDEHGDGSVTGDASGGSEGGGRDSGRGGVDMVAGATDGQGFARRRVAEGGTPDSGEHVGSGENPGGPTRVWGVPGGLTDFGSGRDGTGSDGGGCSIRDRNDGIARERCDAGDGSAGGVGGAAGLCGARGGNDGSASESSIGGAVGLCGAWGENDGIASVSSDAGDDSAGGDSGAAGLCSAPGGISGRGSATSGNEGGGSVGGLGAGADSGSTGGGHGGGGSYGDGGRGIGGGNARDADADSARASSGSDGGRSTGGGRASGEDAGNGSQADGRSGGMWLGARGARLWVPDGGRRVTEIVGAGPISIETVRRLVCDCDIARVLVGPDGEIVELGRTARTASAAQHRLLAIQEGGCTFPGCDRPPHWCQAHHIIWWSNGGRTDLACLTLQCSHHHHLLHEGGYSVRRNPDGTLTFTRPDGTEVLPPSLPSLSPITI